MRINPLPFLFAPGAALGGYLAGGGHGAWLALLAWTMLVALATFAAWWRHRLR